MISASVSRVPILVLGSSPTALAVLRELAASGFRHLYLADEGRGCAVTSRYKRRFFHLRHADSLADVVQRLKRQHGGKPWLIPTSDYGIEHVQRMLDSAPGTAPARAFDAYPTGLAKRFLDKRAFSQLVTEYADFPQPQTVDGALLTGEKPPLPLPFFCKPRRIDKHRGQLPGKKGIIIQSQADWRAWRTRFGTMAADWLCQEIIAGAEDNIVLYAGALDPKGRLLGQFTARKLRQYPPGFGSASLVASESLPEVAQRATAFLQKTGFAGVCCGEFKWCPRRQDWVAIEFNPRPSLWYAAATASGNPLVTLALADALASAGHGDGYRMSGTSATPSSKVIADGFPGDFSPQVLWRYGLKDLASARFYRRHGQDFVLEPPDPHRHGVAAKKRKVAAVFSWKDPLPVAAEWLNYARKTWRRWGKG